MHEDEAAFRRVYELTAPRLRAYLHLAVKDVALADDVLQEAYYRLLRADMNDAAIGQVRSYLYKTARTLVVDHGRRLGRWLPTTGEEWVASNRDGTRRFRRARDMTWLSTWSGSSRGSR